MSFNLIEASKGLFTNELIGQLSSNLGESENGITKAISAILPSIIGGISEQAETTVGASTLLNLASDTHSSGVLNNLSALFGSSANGNKSAGIIGAIFSESKLRSLVNMVSNFAGIKSSSTESLLGFAAPAIMGLIGNQVNNGGLNVSGLNSMLASQKSNLLTAIPASFAWGSLFTDLGEKTQDGLKQVVGSSKVHVNNYAKKTGLIRWLPLLFILAAVAILFYFLKGCNTEKTVGNDIDTIDNTHIAIGTVDSLSGDFIYELGEMTAIKLPNNGGTINVGKNSTEFKLVSFLNDNNAVLDTVKGNWFEFTNVRFKTGGSEITQESKSQLTNMAAIVKSYPNARFKLGGYTDNTGDKTKNLELSQQRADAILEELKKLGISAESFVGSKGFGDEWPISSNETPEGRAQNRRVAVNVKAK